MSLEDTLRLILREEIRAAVREELASVRPTANPASDETLTVEEVAADCAVHAQTVLLWIRSGRLSAKKPGRRWVVRRADLRSFLQGMQNPHRADSIQEQADRILGGARG